MAESPFDYLSRLQHGQSAPVDDPVAATVEAIDRERRLSRNPAKPVAQIDPIAETLRSIRDENLARDLAVTPPPDQVARVSRAARAAGEQPGRVEDRLGEVERALDSRHLRSVLGKYPAFGHWADANPRAVAAAVDDHKALGKIASAFDPEDLARGWSIRATPDVEPNLINSLKGIWASLVGGYKQAELATNLAVGDWLPAMPGVTANQRKVSTESNLREIRQQQARIEEATPAFQSSTVAGLYSGVASLAQMVPGLTASILARNPAPAMAIAGLQTGLPAYGKYRARGGTRAEATAGALIEGGAEAGFELLPMSTVVNKFGRAGVGKFVGEFLGREMLGEQLTTAIQDAADTAIANPDATWGEYWRARPAAAYQTALGVMVASGAIGALHGVASAADKRQRQREQVAAETHMLDAIEEGSAASQLRKRDPEAFRDMLDHLTASMPSDKLFIPAERVREFMQSEGFEDSEFWRGKEDEIREAEATGGDLVLPVSEAMTHLAGTNAWTALRDDARLSAGGMSPAEVAAIANEDAAFSADFERLVPAEAGKARSRLFADAFNKLTDAGFAPNVARIQAELVAQRYIARSARLGRELKGDEFGHVSIMQALPEKLQQARKADAVDLVINALRKGGPAVENSGPTLIEWIAGRGGVADLGGDLHSVGLGDWHRAKPFRRKAIRHFDPAAAMGGISGEGRFGADSVLIDAIDAGYFPELAMTADPLGEGYGSPDPQHLVDAIRDELAGKPRFASDPRVDQQREAADELRSLLDQAGRDPETMSDAEVRRFIEGFGAAAPGEAGSFASGERGSIKFGDDGKAVISLFRSHNLSTFSHEAGHLFLEELKADAAAADAPEQVKADWNSIVAWFKGQGHSLDAQGSIPTEAHEVWARGFERYLMEGRAPSAGLRHVFETVSTWLVSLYRRVERLMSPISDDVRHVMDRLLATDEEIAERHAEQRLDPVFGSAAAAEMTGQEFNAYMDLVAQARSTAKTELLTKALASLKARETEQYKSWEAETRAEVIKAVDARPEFRALAEVERQPLNLQWIVDRYGKDAPGLMPRGFKPSHKEGGAHPDTVAEAVGLGSGRELVETLMGLEKQRKAMREAGDTRTVRSATIEAETQEAMAERYGDPFNSGKLEEEALAAVHNDTQAEVIAAEVRALARRTMKRPTPYSAAREWARAKVRSGSVQEHLTRSAIQQYRRAAAMNAKAAFEALAAGNHAAALRHKEAQLLNNALVREARDVIAEVEVAVRRLDRVAGKRKMVGVNQEYLDQAHALMANVDLSKRSVRQVERQQSFESWASEREAEGYDIAVPRSFEKTIGQTNWTRLSAEELLGLDAAVRQIIHVGRQKQTLIVANEEREHDAKVREAQVALSRLPLRKQLGMRDPSRWYSLKSFASGGVAALLKMETLFKRLDGSGHGVFNQVVFQPIAQAQAEEQALLKQIQGELDKHLAAVPAKILATWEDKLDVPELFDPATHEPIEGPRSRLIAAALNVGNEGNLAKLAGGYGWRPETLLRVLHRELKAEEWRYVQNVWDTIESLWPRIVKLEKRVNGIAPDKVRSRRIDTSAGLLRGGYFPVAYDPGRSRTAAAQQAKGDNRLFENTYSKPGTSRGFTKERTAVERPVMLDLKVINRHVAEVVHDLTHREAVMQADRFLSDPRLLDAVDETLGPDFSSLFRPWLQHVANEWSYDRAGNDKVERFMRASRRNVTFVGMAYRIGTMISQVAGYTNSVERVGAKAMAVGFNAFMRHPKATTEFALARSHELRSRLDTLDRDIRENVRRYAGKADPASMAKRYAFHGIGWFDRMVAIPTWLAGYNKAIEAGFEENAAIHEADSAVRESQGAGGAKDLSAIQRGQGRAGELGKALTQFYSFHSALFQRFVTLAWDSGDAWRAKRPEMIPELAARGLMLTIVGPALQALLSGQGPDDDSEEGWASWASKLAVYSLAAPIPIARDVVPILVKRATGEKSFGYRFTPVQGIYDSVIRAADDTRKIAKGDETKRATRDLLEAAGYTTGMIPGQAAATAQFFVDVISGDAEPETLGDWWQGVTKGKLDKAA